MDLAAFISTLKPAGTYDVWVEKLAEGGRSLSRAALEHYVNGRRKPDAEVFCDLLVCGGRARDDAEGWAVFARSVGIPDGVVGTDPEQAAG